MKSSQAHSPGKQKRRQQHQQQQQSSSFDMVKGPQKTKSALFADQSLTTTFYVQMSEVSEHSGAEEDCKKEESSFQEWGREGSVTLIQESQEEVIESIQSIPKKSGWPRDMPVQLKEVVQLCISGGDITMESILQTSKFKALQDHMRTSILTTWSSSKRRQITLPRIPSAGTSNFINSLCVLEGNRLACGSGDSCITLWDLATGLCTLVLIGHTSAVNDLLELPDGSLVSCSNDHTVRIWDSKLGTCLRTLSEHTNWVLSLCLSKNNRIVSGSYDDTLRIWTMIGECLRVLRGHTYGVYCVCTLSDGIIASGSVDNTIKLWDMLSADAIGTLEGHTETVLALCPLSDRERCFASAGIDKTIRIWGPVLASSPVYHCLKVFHGHTDSIRAIRQLADGKIISCGYDDTIKVWHLKLNICVKEIRVHRNRVKCLAVDVDGLTIISGGGDRTIRFTNSAGMDDFD
jgi:WD40 repeat protein